MSDVRTLSRDFIREFIELYRAHTCLWQTKSKEYLDKNKKNEAYKLLLKKLQTVQPNATKNIVLNKINTFRGGFRREYKKVIASSRTGTAADDIYVPTLWYYDLLLFVRDQDTPRNSTSNIPDDEEDNVEENSQDVDEENEIHDNTGEARTESQAHSEYSQHDLPSISDTIASRLSSDPATPSSSLLRSRKGNSNKRKTAQTLDKAEEILNVVSARLNHHEDEFTIIGKNVAVKLRRLSNKTKIYTEKLINDLLFQAELGKINEYTKITSEEIQPAPSNSMSHQQPSYGGWHRSMLNNDNYELTDLDNTSSNNSAGTYYGSSYNPLNNSL